MTTQNNVSGSITYPTHRRNNRRDWGRPQLLGWGDQQCIGPTQLLGCSFQIARNFTASVTRMQDLASEFSKIFRGWHPWTLTTEGGRPPPALNTQPGLWPGAGHKRPVLGPKPWSPSTFQPWLHPWSYIIIILTADERFWQTEINNHKWHSF